MAARTPLGPKQGSQLRHVQSSTGTVNHPLKDLLHLSAAGEEQVPAVLDLVDRILVVKPSPLLLQNIQSETQARRIDPPLAHLVQSPYRLILGQGICDPRQACTVGDVGETVALLAEVELGLPRPAGDVLMAVQDDLGAEGWVTTHLDRNVAPLRIHDVEGVVVHIGFLLLEQDAARTGTSDVPQRHLRSSDKNQKQATLHRVGGKIVFGQVVLALSASAVDNWNSVSLGEAAHSTTEATGHAHEMSVVQLLVGAAHQPPPPLPKATGRVADPVVRIQDNPVDAVVGPVE